MQNNCVKFDVNTVGHARLINRIRAESISIYRVKSSGKHLRFWVLEKDKCKIIALLDTLCYNYQIVCERTYRAYARAVLDRKGIVVGLLIALFALCTVPQMTLKVEVNDSAYLETVRSIIAEDDLVSGVFLRKGAAQKLESKIRSLEGVSFAKVAKRGISLLVTVQEELAPLDILSEPSGSVACKKMAIVSRITVYSGTAVVKIGDIVSSGDVLIAPYVAVGDAQVPCVASGEVYGRVFYEFERLYPPKTVITSAGRSKTYSRCEFFGMKSNLPPSPYESYTSVTEVQTTGVFFPIRITKVTYTELLHQTVDGETDREKMKKSLFADAIATLSEFAAVVGCTDSAVETENGVLIKICIETEEKIG